MDHFWGPYRLTYRDVEGKKKQQKKPWRSIKFKGLLKTQQELSNVFGQI